jgi:hypothetical protein
MIGIIIIFIRFTPLTSSKGILSVLTYLVRNLGRVKKEFSILERWISKEII